MHIRKTCVFSVCFFFPLIPSAINLYTIPRFFSSVTFVMNSTCIHYEGSRSKYIHVQVLGNIHKTSYTTEKLQKIHIHLPPSPPNSRWINDTEFGEVEHVLNSGLCLSKEICQLNSIIGRLELYPNSNIP